MEERRIQAGCESSTQGGEEVKRTRTRTLRGQILPASGVGKKQIIVDDGLINRGYKVTGFFVWSSTGGDSFLASLSFNPVLLASRLDAADNSQFGWAWKSGAAAAPQEYIIDPDHVAVRDLHVTIMDAGADVLFNYLVVIEEYQLNDDEAIMNIIKEGAQSL